MPDKIKVPAWDDERANRILHPDWFDDNGKEIVKGLVVYFTKSERARLKELKSELKCKTEQAVIKRKIFG